MSEDKIIHILRYGTVAEKAHLETAKSAYDYLSINGNTAAYVPNAIATFVVQNFFNNHNHGFFIDPITYAFQKEIKLLRTKKNTIKKSVQKLIECYGDPILKINEELKVSINDFNDETQAKGFCKRVLEFQFSTVSKRMKDNDLSDYLSYATGNTSENQTQLQPQFLIAPYFYLEKKDREFEKWLELNTRFINMASDLSKEEFKKPVFGQIVINKDILLDNDSINIIATKYNNCKCEGLTIWVDDFNEHVASKAELLGLIKLLKVLKCKNIYNMYGGYFSILLTNRQVNLLKGVSHGLEYGESRAVYPVGGGIPTSKYYFYPVHQRLDFSKAFYLLQHRSILDTSLQDWGNCKKYYDEICKCNQCIKIMKNSMINFVQFESTEFYEVRQKNHTLRRKKASQDTKANCLYHYLLCKKMEFLHVDKRPISLLINELLIAKSQYKDCDAIDTNELNYIDTWADVLKQFIRVKENE